VLRLLASSVAAAAAGVVDKPGRVPLYDAGVAVLRAVRFALVVRDRLATARGFVFDEMGGTLVLGDRTSNGLRACRRAGDPRGGRAARARSGVHQRDQPDARHTRGLRELGFSLPDEAMMTPGTQQRASGSCSGQHRGHVWRARDGEP